MHLTRDRRKVARRIVSVAIAAAAILAVPNHGATSSGVASSLTVRLVAQNGSRQPGTATLASVLGSNMKPATLVRVRIGPPVKFPGRQVILIRSARCAAYATKVGDDLYEAGPVKHTVGLAVNRRSYLISARLATLTTGRFSIQVSTASSPETVVACGNIPRA